MLECTTLVQSRYMQYTKRRMCDFYLIFIDVCGYRKWRSVLCIGLRLYAYTITMAVQVYSRKLQLHADYSPLAVRRGRPVRRRKPPRLLAPRIRRLLDFDMGQARRPVQAQGLSPSASLSL